MRDIVERQPGTELRRRGQPDAARRCEAMRQAERELALQAQRAYERTVNDRQSTGGERDSGPRI